MSSADGDRLNSFDRLDESRALEHLGGRCGRRALGSEEAQVDEPGTCDVLLVAEKQGTSSGEKTYRS